MIQFPQFDEPKVKSQIESIYKSKDLASPTILILDSPLSCSFAYKFVLDLYNLRNLNLIEQHLNVSPVIDWNNRNEPIKLRRFYPMIFPFISHLPINHKIIESIKNQFWGNQRLTDSWNIIKEDTKNLVRNKKWNQIISSKIKYFEFPMTHHISNEIKEVFFAIFMKTYCIVCKYPLYALTDDNNLPHSIDGKSIEFTDGFGGYAVHGILFDEELYSKIYLKRNITSEEILSIKNMEQRACAIEFYGYDKLIKELHAIKLDERYGTSDVTGMPVYDELYEFKMNGRTFRFVRVEDYSTHTIHCLGVPAIEQTKTCLGAVAWTYNMTIDEYKPSIRT